MENGKDAELDVPLFKKIRLILIKIILIINIIIVNVLSTYYKKVLFFWFNKILVSFATSEFPFSLK